MGICTAMTDHKTLVPDGISHELDLSGMKPEQRQKHHAEQMRVIGFYQGKDGIDDYRRRHPDAKALVELKSLAYLPKPSGYPDALASMIDCWFVSDLALSATNGADVARLNAKLQTDRFNTGNHFSKPLSASILKKLSAVFEQHGASLPATAKTMSAVRKAVRAFKAGDNINAKPFGTVGTRNGDTLIIGGHSYKVSRNGTRECIRLTVGGNKRRLYLDDILAVAGLLAGGEPGNPSNYLLHSNIGERAYSSEIASEPDPLDNISGRTGLTADSDDGVSRRTGLFASRHGRPALPLRTY